MLLGDCIGLSKELEDSRVQFIKTLGRIIEIRAVTYKDLASTSGNNNLYNVYHMWKHGTTDNKL